MSAQIVNQVDQIDSKNEWLLLSASCTAKFGLGFVLTLEKAFSWGFILKPTEWALSSSKKRC